MIPRLLRMLVVGLLPLWAMNTACLPPKCKIPTCQILIDHAHPKYGREIAVVGESSGGRKKAKRQMRDVTGGQGMKEGMALAEPPMKFYRGLPWYAFFFKQRYKAPNIEISNAEGFYRQLDERELQKYRRPLKVSPEQIRKYDSKMKAQQAKQVEKNAKMEEKIKGAANPDEEEGEETEKKGKKKKKDKVVEEAPPEDEE